VALFWETAEGELRKDETMRKFVCGSPAARVGGDRLHDISDQ